MPEYDFICEECHISFSRTFSYQDYDNKEIICPACGGRKTARRISRVRISRSESRYLDELSELADPRTLEKMENNPQEMGKVMRKMSLEIGEDIGAQFDDVVERLEHGQSSEEIEQSIPDVDSPTGE